MLIIRGAETLRTADIVTEAIAAAGGELKDPPEAAVILHPGAMPDLPGGIPVIWYTEAEQEHMLPGRQNLSIHRWGEGRDRKVIHLPVQPAEGPPEPGKKAACFLFCGTGEPGSGQKTFLRAMATLPEEVKAILPEGAEVEGIIPRGRLASGEESRTAIAAVLPHLTGSEGGEEAIALMARGMPVLSTPSGRHRDIVADGVSGLYHTPGNHVQLASQMRHLMENHGLWSYLSANAIERWRSEFSHAAAVRGWAGVMEQLRLR